jgi:hypothetical protein
MQGGRLKIQKLAGLVPNSSSHMELRAVLEKSWELMMTTTHF